MSSRASVAILAARISALEADSQPSIDDVKVVMEAVGTFILPSGQSKAVSKVHEDYYTCLLRLLSIVNQAYNIKYRYTSLDVYSTLRFRLIEWESRPRLLVNFVCKVLRIHTYQHASRTLADVAERLRELLLELGCRTLESNTQEERLRLTEVLVCSCDAVAAAVGLLGLTWILVQKSTEALKAVNAQSAQLVSEELAAALRHSHFLEHASRLYLVAAELLQQYPGKLACFNGTVELSNGLQATLNNLGALTLKVVSVVLPMARDAPGVTAVALRQVLSGRCLRHLLLSLGVALLAEADGGPDHGMPRELRCSLLPLLRDSDPRSGQFAANSPEQPLIKPADILLCMLGLLHLKLPVPAPGRRGSLALALRTGRLAVAAAKEWTRAAGGAGAGEAVGAAAAALGSGAAAATDAAVVAAAEGEAGSGAGHSGVACRQGAAAGSPPHRLPLRSLLPREEVGRVASRSLASVDCLLAGTPLAVTPVAPAAPPPPLPVRAAAGAQGGSGGAAAAASPTARLVEAAEDRWRLAAAIALDAAPLLGPEELSQAAAALSLDLDVNHLYDPEVGMAPSPPPAASAALRGGLVRCLEALMRRAGRDPAGPHAAVLGKVLHEDDHHSGYLHLLLAYGDPREAAALVETVAKLFRRIGPSRHAIAAEGAASGSSGASVKRAFVGSQYVLWPLLLAQPQSALFALPAAGASAAAAAGAEVSAAREATPKPAAQEAAAAAAESVTSAAAAAAADVIATRAEPQPGVASGAHSEAVAVAAEPAAEAGAATAAPQARMEAAAASRGAPQQKAASPPRRQLAQMLGLLGLRCLPLLSRYLTTYLPTALAQAEAAQPLKGPGAAGAAVFRNAMMYTCYELGVPLVAWLQLLPHLPREEGGSGSGGDGVSAGAANTQPSGIDASGPAVDATPAPAPVYGASSCAPPSSWREFLLGEGPQCVDAVRLLGAIVRVLALQRQFFRPENVPDPCLLELLRNTAKACSYVAAACSHRLWQAALAAAEAAAAAQLAGLARGGSTGAETAAGNGRGGGDKAGASSGAGTSAPSATAAGGGGDAIDLAYWPPPVLFALGSWLRENGEVNAAARVQLVASQVELWQAGLSREGLEGDLESLFTDVPADASHSAARSLPPPGSLRLLLPRCCAHPGCVNLGGDSEAGLRLLGCRGCGDVAYCSRECQLAHWRAGHRAACGALRGRK